MLFQSPRTKHGRKGRRLPVSDANVSHLWNLRSFPACSENGSKSGLHAQVWFHQMAGVDSKAQGKLFFNFELAVADPRFPRGVCANHREGCANLLFGKSLVKTTWKWKKFNWERVSISSIPLWINQWLEVQNYPPPAEVSGKHFCHVRAFKWCYCIEAGWEAPFLLNKLVPLCDHRIIIDSSPRYRSM